MQKQIQWENLILSTFSFLSLYVCLLHPWKSQSICQSISPYTKTCLKPDTMSARQTLSMRDGVYVFGCVCVRGSVRELSGAGCDDVQAVDCSGFRQASFTKTADSAVLLNCCEGFARSSVIPHNSSHSVVSQQSTLRLCPYYWASD